MNTNTAEIAALAARWVVEEGLEYGASKKRAVKQLGLSSRAALPTNEQVEDAVKDYLALFCADSQPLELQALRRLALTWLERLASFRPHLTGAVWRGTATRLSDIYIQLFCDDAKAAEIALIDQHVKYDVRSVMGFRGELVDALSVHVFCVEFAQDIGVHLMIYDFDDLRGALKPDAHGRTWRGDALSLKKLLQEKTNA